MDFVTLGFGIACVIGALIFLAFKFGYSCGYRQGWSDTMRQTTLFSRRKTMEISRHGRN